ncbi:MAG: Gfo/Idh/MocA family oxidoreductase [Proteobacteria bacterium]|nr:Gfo/Idh/MocA family oxidoreductase [Pseudomonadota bacterium]
MYRIAAVGTGYFARNHYEAWNRIDSVQIAALCDTDIEKAEQCAKDFGVPKVYNQVSQMLDEIQPDILDIISPSKTHLQYVKEAAKRGINIICQKPLSPSFAEARELIGKAEDSGILLVIHENFRFMPWFRKSKEFIKQGHLGDIHNILFRFRPGDGQGPGAYLDRQPYFQKLNRFLIHETGIHFIDTFRYLCGEVKSVYAYLRQINPVITGEDAGYVIFEFENGSSGLFDGSRLNDHVADYCRLTFGEMFLEGSLGVLRLDGYGRLWWKPHGQSETELAYEWNNMNFSGDCVYGLLSHVMNHLEQGTGIENAGRDYLANLYVEEAIYHSNEKKKQVQLNDFIDSLTNQDSSNSG